MKEIKEFEEWRDIIGYEGLYMVSNLGNVKSLNYNHTKEERILKKTINKGGYLYVNLHKDAKQKYYLVHRLVAQAFIPNPENKPYIDHINTDKTDNRIENLRWVTNKENCNNPISKINRSIAHKGKKKSQEHKDKLSKAKKGKISYQKPILQFNREGTKIIGKFISAKQASKELNINPSHISSCCKGKLKSIGGFRWMYLEDYINYGKNF